MSGSGRALPPKARVVLSNGKRPCRGCGAELPARRSSWCSDDCKERHYMALSTYARGKVWDRDKGICELCGCDTDFLRRIFWILRHRDEADGFLAVKRAWGLTTMGWYSTWSHPNMWEADHRIPLAEGGTHDLENYRTLCVPCHRDETRALRRRLSGRSSQGVLL